MSSGTNMVHCQLWMGGLEPYMTESFILQSFQRMGEKPLNVKVMRNKYTGEPAGYCFVHFENDDEAIDAMHKLNGKIIPGTNPAVRFRLNTASNQGKIMINEREFSLWVGDLSPEVDDYTLFKCFAAKYQSIKAAKVILDASGYSKGFGFLRFGLEEEQKHCLSHMNGYKGLGAKPLKISNAIPKSQRSGPPNGPPMNQQQGGGGGYQYPPDYSHYYDPNYWQNYGQWGSYGYDPSGGGGYGTGYDPSSGAYAQYGGQYPGQYGGQYPGQYGGYPPPAGGYPHPPYTGYYPPQTPATGPPPPTAPVTSAPPPTAAAAPVDDANEVVEHSTPVDVEKENREYADAILNYWVDLSSNCGINKDIFEEEMSKLNVIEVSNPTVTVKFETRLAAKRAVEAQGQEGLLTSASSDSSDSEEPETKKRRLSTDTKSGDESSKEGGAKKEETDTKVKAEAEDGVTIQQEDITKDGGEAAERIDAEDVESTFDVKVKKFENEEAKEKMRAECRKVIGFMATVDVEIMMNETERVSSDSSSDSADSEGEADSKKAKDKKSKSREKPEDKMETDDAEKSVANSGRGDGEDKNPDGTDVVTKDGVTGTDGGDKTVSLADEPVEVLRRETICIDDMDEMSQPSDGEEIDRVSIQPVVEEPDNAVSETTQPASGKPHPELAPKDDPTPVPAAGPSEDPPSPEDHEETATPVEELKIEEYLDDNPQAELVDVLPSSIVVCDDESGNSLDVLVKANCTSDVKDDPTSDVAFSTLLNGQDGLDGNSSYSPEQDQNSSNSPLQDQNSESSDESSD